MPVMPFLHRKKTNPSNVPTTSNPHSGDHDQLPHSPLPKSSSSSHSHSSASYSHGSATADTGTPGGGTYPKPSGNQNRPQPPTSTASGIPSASFDSPPPTPSYPSAYHGQQQYPRTQSGMTTSSSGASESTGISSINSGSGYDSAGNGILGKGTREEQERLADYGGHPAHYQHEHHYDHRQHQEQPYLDSSSHSQYPSNSSAASSHASNGLSDCVRSTRDPNIQGNEYGNREMVYQDEYPKMNAASGGDADMDSGAYAATGGSHGERAGGIVVPNNSGPGGLSAATSAMKLTSPATSIPSHQPSSSHPHLEQPLTHQPQLTTSTPVTSAAALATSASSKTAHLQSQPLRKTSSRYSLTDFAFIRTLGTGSFGRVHLVRSNHNARYYAVKVLSKERVVKMKQVEHTNSEREMLERVRHPFLVNLWGTFKDSKNLYMVMDFVAGGELFSLLRKSQRFPDPVAKFFAAEVALALDYLHSLDIIYRDLKPENILLAHDGHIKITDFGFAKHVPDITWTLCGTPDYLAPEIVQSRGYNKSVDWYAFGILVFEMLAGYPPFFSEDPNPMRLYEKIIAGKIRFPSHFQPDSKDLLKCLLTSDLSKRYGNLANGSQDIFAHKWFAEVDWAKLYKKEIPAPYIPRVEGDGDSSCFDNYEEPDISEYGRQGEDPHGHLFATF